MAVKIRLARHGSKKKPFYRVVVTDEENKRDGRFIEILGVYCPLEQNKKINLKSDRIQHWVKQGAQMSETVASLVKQSSKAQPAA